MTMECSLKESFTEWLFCDKVHDVKPEELGVWHECNRPSGDKAKVGLVIGL